MSIKIKTGKIKGYPSIIIQGDIIGKDSSKVTKYIKSFLEKGDHTLVIDFCKTTIIDSYGLGALVYLWKLFQEDKRKLIFLCRSLNEDDNPFTSSNLNRVFTIVTSVEEL